MQHTNLIVEDVPNEDNLYYRIHKKEVRNGKVPPGSFSEKGEGTEKGMSTDWSKYATPEEALNRPTERYPEGDRTKTHGIISLNVGKVREIDNIIVVHAPLFENVAHTHIKGIPPQDPSKTEVRSKLARIYRFEIVPPIE
jgi:hypothetical protein